MNPGPQTFRKTERLCSKRVITNLFTEGEVLYTPLFRVVWCLTAEESEFPARVAFSVLKKNFRHAVDRNLVRRRMREAYRKNKQELYEKLSSNNVNIAFMIIYRGTQITASAGIENAMKEMIARLAGAVKRKHDNC